MRLHSLMASTTSQLPTQLDIELAVMTIMTIIMITNNEGNCIEQLVCNVSLKDIYRKPLQTTFSKEKKIIFP